MESVNTFEDTSMNWEHHLYGRSYMATANGYQAMIWKTTTGEWSALVSRQNVAVAHNQFLRLQDAQAWCGQQMTQMQFKEREAGA
jgi:hypothetical protein